MPGEVVGTAYVRIKALVDDLAKDIKKDVTKSLKDADLGKVGEAEGKKIGEGMGNSSADAFKDTVKKQYKGVFQSVADEAKKTSDEIKKELNLRDTDILPEASGFDKFLRNIKLKLNEADIGFQKLRDNIRDRFNSAGDSARVFFGRVSAGFKSMSKIDKDSGFGDALDRIGKKLKDFGDGGFGDLLNKLPLKIGAIAGAIVGAIPYIQDVGAAVLAYATGLVAQIGFLVTALGGIGAAAAAAIGTTATIALPLVLAFKSETEALIDFKDELAATKEEFLRIGTATQASLLPGLTEALFVLEDLVEPLSEFGLFVGRAASNFALFFANVLTGDEAMGRFQAILQSALRIFDLLAPTIINVGNILSGIWVASLPAAERFVEALGDVIANLSSIVSEGVADGSLARTITEWYERAELLGSAISNVAGALFDILEIGADSSDNVFVRFDEWAERYRAFTESEAGQNRIALIFENALAVMREVNGIAADLFDGIFGRLGEVGGVNSLVEALQRFREVLPGIQEGFQDILGPIKEVVELVLDNFGDKMAKAFDELAEPLDRLVTQILDLLRTMDESGAFELFLDLLRIMTDTLSALLAIPGFGTFIGYMIAFGGAAKVARLALGPFIGVFGSFITQIGQLYALKAGAALTDSATGLTRFIAGFRGAAPAVQAGTQALQAGSQAATTAAANITANSAGLAGQLGGGVRAMGAMSSALPVLGAALAIGGTAFLLHQQKVQRWEQEIRQAEEALGTLNGGLLISADGIAEYIRESSHFADRGQLDAITELGFSVETLADQIALGTLSYEEFAQAAADAGNLGVLEVVDQNTNVLTLQQVDSIQALGEQYDLTAEQLEDLSAGIEVFTANNERLVFENEDVLRSFDQLNNVIGEGVKNNIDDFISNQTNIDLLGPQFLASLKETIDDADAEDAIEPMRAAYEQLGAAAREASGDIVGVSDDTRRMIREQTSTIADSNARAVAELELLKQEQLRVFDEIQANFDLFTSDTFNFEFRAARDAVLDFSQIVENADLTNFDFAEAFGGIDVLAATFPEVGNAALNLFTQLEGLPEAEFNAAATAMGADADALRGAMEGAMTAIQQLQDQAVASLPTIGSLLNDATSVEEDGSQAFDPEGFLRAAQDRVAETNNFATHIADIQARYGDETARLAAQEGPAAAAALAELTGSAPNQVNEVIAQMEAAEASLRTQISTVLGPGIALEYLGAGDLIGSNTTIGISQGLNDPAAIAALTAAGESAAQTVANQLQFTFDETPNGFRARRLPAPSGNNGSARIRFISAGGFVDGVRGAFGGGFPGGPRGTDTVPAWLTPGEFVLRRKIAQMIPANVLTALNAGDKSIIEFLASFNKNQVRGVAGGGSFTSAGASGSGDKPGVSIGDDLSTVLNVIAGSIAASAKIASEAAVSISVVANDIMVQVGTQATAVLTRAVELNADAAAQAARVAAETTMTIDPRSGQWDDGGTGAVENLIESMTAIGRSVTYNEARRLVDSTRLSNGGHDFERLPGYLLDAFSSRGAFFEDFSFRPGGLPPGWFGHSAAGQKSAPLPDFRQQGPGTFGTTAGQGSAGGNIIIENMNIEAPTPLESSRQVASRLRILSSQMVGR